MSSQPEEEKQRKVFQVGGTACPKARTGVELWQDPNTKLALEAQVTGEKRAAVREPGCSAEGLGLHPESEGSDRYILGQASWLLCGRATRQVMGQDVRLL